MFYLNHKTITPEYIELWQTVRLLIIEEISFADKNDFDKIDNNLRNLKQNQTKPFGGINIVFSGDMRQLEPVGENKKPVYEQECPLFKIVLIVSLNQKDYIGSIKITNGANYYTDFEMVKSQKKTLILLIIG